MIESLAAAPDPEARKEHIRAAMEATSEATVTPARHGRRRPTVTTILGRAAAVLLAFAVGVSGLAAQAMLPGPIQHAVAEVAAIVGIHLPTERPDDSPFASCDRGGGIRDHRYPLEEEWCEDGDAGDTDESLGVGDDRANPGSGDDSADTGSSADVADDPADQETSDDEKETDGDDASRDHDADDEDDESDDEDAEAGEEDGEDEQDGDDTGDDSDREEETGEGGDDEGDPKDD